MVDNSIYDWYFKCSKDGESRQWEDNRKGVSVTDYVQYRTTEVIRINFINCFPISYTAPEFDAKNNELATEQIEMTIKSFKIERTQKNLKS
ncbi:phage tail protein [Nostoc sp. UHCC 0302]|uniref:phage tail protein n=1 Tax=Nostoc sp. UHCC 0302 TaxID=3134896 RepID=UPI00311C8C3E